MKDKKFNISEYLPLMAKNRPFQKAVVFPYKRDSSGHRSYTHLTFRQLNIECDRYAYGLSLKGFKQGFKVLLMVKPSIEFVAITFALFKMGCVPILIDPGMGKKRLLDCIKGIKPDAVIGTPKAHILRILYRKHFKTAKINVIAGGYIPLIGLDIEKISPEIDKDFIIANTDTSSLAAILFTSGSTGPAKGVSYTHGMFGAQVTLLKETFGFEAGEIDLPGLFIFALFDVALGITCVIPDMDPTRPAKVNAEKFVEIVNDFGVTTSYGSPAIWKRVGEYCKNKNIIMPSYKRIMMSGAPVPGDLILRFKELIPNGEVYTPYGATESLPVSFISGEEIKESTYEQSQNGKGICVGYPVSGIEIKIINISDNIIQTFQGIHFLDNDEIGEIIVKGEAVTKEYYQNKKATEMAKIYNDDSIWHRIGDLGYFDNKGRLWFLGRKNHRVEYKNNILYSVACEAIYNRHHDVYRSALVGIGKLGQQRPVIIIEPHKDKFPDTKKKEEQFKIELNEIASSFEHCLEIKDILFHRSLPVDIRHNAKIFREKLKIWVEQVLV